MCSSILCAKPATPPIPGAIAIAPIWGAVFNLAHTWSQLGPLRPHIRDEQVRGLYWVGGAVHPGSGLLTILEAARSTVFFLEQDMATTAATPGRVAHAQ